MHLLSKIECPTASQVSKHFFQERTKVNISPLHIRISYFKKLIWEEMTLQKQRMKMQVTNLKIRTFRILSRPIGDQQQNLRWLASEPTWRILQPNMIGEGQYSTNGNSNTLFPKKKRIHVDELFQKRRVNLHVDMQKV